MLPHDIAALVRGLHADPFAVLGPHQVGQDLTVRAFWPRAQAIDVVAPDGQNVRPMTRLHAEGMFERLLSGTAREGFDYRLRVTLANGHAFTLDDPFRYGPVLTDYDLHLLAEGTQVRAFEKLGARPITHGIRSGVHFAVWAPNARRVSVVGDFNGWDGRVHPMRVRSSGYWEMFIPDLGAGDRYKFEVLGADGAVALKADPCGRYFEIPPRTASIVWLSDQYAWVVEAWMAARAGHDRWIERPMSIYGVHLGGWRKWPDGRLLTYRRIGRNWCLT
jgi:1,4-alpha-glucan branching enzyme